MKCAFRRVKRNIDGFQNGMPAAALRISFRHTSRDTCRGRRCYAVFLFRENAKNFRAAERPLFLCFDRRPIEQAKQFRLQLNRIVHFPDPPFSAFIQIYYTCCEQVCQQFVFSRKQQKRKNTKVFFLFPIAVRNYFIASATATAQATVAPTIGLLPMPMRPIISTCAGTEEEPANCASPCIRPMESVRP